MPNILKKEKQIQIARALSEGNGIRPTARITGTAKGTVSKLQRALGEVCGDAQDVLFRNLVRCHRFQADEIWAFVKMKAKTARRKGLDNTPKHGDIWTHTAICADTKLSPCWFVGPRDGASALAIMTDLADRVPGRIQLTTDGHEPYLEAVETAWGMDIDYGQLVKRYADNPEPQKRYSPAKLTSIEKRTIQGKPDHEHTSTSFVESHNLQMRMRMRRFTRLTNGHSKKEECHVAAVSFHFFVYNLIRPHTTLTERAGGHITTPAMAAGLVTRPYSYEDMIDLLDWKG